MLRVESCAVLTTEASAAARPAHARMPCVLGADEIEAWLDARARPDEVQSLLRPTDAVALYPVSTFVNSARNQGPRCLEPAA